MLRFCGYMLCAVLWCLIDLSGASAQYLNFFGRNKVQYSAFDWKVMQTEHIDLYYFPEERELAERAAASAERSYRALESQFSLSIHRRIPLILYSTHQFFEETNTIPNFLPESVGAFTEFLKGRVVMPNLGSYHEFDKVLRHELIHVFTLEKIKSVLKNHRKPLRVGPPLWFTEGLAEHWSEGWSSEADLFIRDAVLSGYLVPISDIRRIFGSFLMYKEGQSFLKFIEGKYGDDAIELIFENWWRGKSFEEIIALTFGVSLKQLSDEWVYALRKEYYPLMEKADSPAVVSKLLTRRGLNIKPVSVPDAQDPTREAGMVFLSTRHGYEDICWAPLDGTEDQVELLVRGGRSANFESFHFLRTKMDVNKRQQLAFISQSRSRDVLNIWNLKTRKQDERFTYDGLIGMSSPSWAPDGRRVVFTGLNEAGNSDLYIVDTGDGNLRKLTNDVYEDNEPSWSPDGKVIVFSSDRTDGGEMKGWHNLFSYEVETGAIEWLTYGAHNDRSPSWSPDGRWVAFVSDRGVGLDIYLIDADRRTYQATNMTTGALDINWTADSKHLLMTCFERFQFQVHKLTLPDSLTPVDTPVKIDKSLALWDPIRIQESEVKTTAPYKNQYSLDLAQGGFIALPQSSDIAFGGGALFSFSDMLGNYHYNFLVSNSTETTSDFLKSFNVFASRMNLSNRLNYGFGVFHLNGRFFNERDGLFDERRIGAVFLYEYPFSQYARLEGNFGILHSNRDRPFLRDPDGQAELVTNYLSYVKDTLLWGPTGPIDGEGYQFSVNHLTDIRRGATYTTTLLGDYRRYYRLSNRISYASRGLSIASFGRQPQIVRLGGSWDFRGYPFRALRGDRMFLVNQELRFPLLDVINLGFPFGGMSFSRIYGAVFVDAGSVWFNDNYDSVLGSFGAGIRMGLGGPLVLRFDFARQVTDNFTNLEPGLKFTFWFGPDF